jgi:hypothetical protein
MRASWFIPQSSLGDPASAKPMPDNRFASAEEGDRLQLGNGLTMQEVQNDTFQAAIHGSPHSHLHDRPRHAGIGG